jgi:hypothetical protein
MGGSDAREEDESGGDQDKKKMEMRQENWN